MQRGQHLREVHTSEVHTSEDNASEVNTPQQGNHTKALNHNHDPAPDSHLRCGARLLLSPHLNGQSRAHSLGAEKKHKKRVSSQVRDLWTIHNQWTQTIAIGLNTLQRSYICTYSNRAKTGINRPKLYHTN
jgi:hypothetical protein